MTSPTGTREVNDGRRLSITPALVLLLLSLPAQAQDSSGGPWVSERIAPPFLKAVSHGSTVLPWYKKYRRLYKFSVWEDGVSGLKFEELSGGDPAALPVDISRLRILHRGKELPFLVHPDTAKQFAPGVAVLFPAERAYLDRVRRESDPYQVEGIYWIGETSDTGIYEPAKIFLNTPEGDTIARGFYRWENRNTYHGGNGSDPVRNQSADAPGRGWYSARIRSGQVSTISFGLPGLTQKPVKNTTLTLRLVSSTAPQEPLDVPDHRIVLVLNGTTIADTSFFGYQERLLKIDIPSPSVMEQGNSLRLTSQNTGNSINEVLLDYILAEYDRDLFAQQNRLRFRVSSDEPVVRRFAARGFVSPAVALFRYGDIDSTWTYVAGAKVTRVGNSFQLSFEDTVLGNVEYVAAGIDSAHIPTELRPVGFHDLVDSTNEADYIILTTSPLFRAGEDLAAFRSQTRGVRSKVVDVEQVFDLFGFGHQSPFAIKEFFTIARTQWGGKPPRYAVLLGEANWDARGYSSVKRPASARLRRALRSETPRAEPRGEASGSKTQSSRSVEANLLPSFGNPVSDVWLTTVESLHQAVPQLSVGRIPARTPEEAERYIQYLKEYETYGPSLLNKNVLLLTGGISKEENSAFAAYMESLAAQYVDAFPFAGIPRRVYKKSEAIEFKESVEIRKAIEEGAAWVAFFGHAASTTWDNAINSPRQLRNSSRRKHIVSDLSCSTNKFAEPDIRCFGEEFLFDQEDAAIAYLGSTGLGFIGPLHEIGRSLFQAVFRDTVRIIGDALQRVRVDLWKTFGPSLVGISTIQQYTLLGDPLISIALPTQPDLVIRPQDVRVDKLPVTDKDTAITVTARVYNFGLGVQDSVQVRFRSDFGGVTTSGQNKTLPRLGTIDSVAFTWNPAGKGGEHTLSLELDPMQQQPDADRVNNRYQFPISVHSSELAVLRPLPFSTSTGDSVLVSVDVPILLEQGSRLEIQIDTVRPYSSSVLTVPLLHGGVIDHWFRGLKDRGIYRWRVRLVGAAGASSWTEQVFSTDFTTTSSWLWSQDARTLTEEFNGGTGVQFGPKGVRLKRGSRSMTMRSAGFSDGNVAEIFVDGFDVLTGVVFRGLNTVRIGPRNGDVLEVRNFDTWGDSSSVPALVAYLQSLPAGEYLAIAAKDEASRLVNNTLREAMQTLGAVRFDTLRNRDAYLLLGRKGTAPGSVPEGLRRQGSGFLEMQASAEFKETNGSVRSPWIGPARTWTGGGIELGQGTIADSVLMLAEAFGEEGDTVRVAGNARIVSSLLTTIPAVRYPFLRISAILSEQAAFEGSEPELRSWSVTYDPPSELAFVEGGFFVSPDHADEGTPVQVRGAVHNGGYAAADSVVVELRSLNTSTPLLLDRLIIPQILQFQKVPFDFSIPTKNMTGRQRLQVVIDPGSYHPEFLKSNNSALAELTVLRDTLPPTIIVTVDGREIVQGDYISAEPEILIRLFDAGPLSLADTTALKVFLNGSLVSYTGGELTLETGSGNLKTQARYTPLLPDGEHLLQVMAFDASGNGNDSSSSYLRFRVNRYARLLNVLNYPNPFSRETHFTFTIVGSNLPDRVRVRVYTVAGRLVQEIEAQPGSLHFGFNIIAWDGRDREGGMLANGTYFYKVVATTDREHAEVLGRLGILR